MQLIRKSYLLFNRLTLALFLLGICLFGKLNCFGEVSYQDIEIRDRFFHGVIDDKYPITIYLSVENLSPEHSNIYSISGYYYYDKIKEQIPLVGIFDGDLTLYAFDSPKQADSIIFFKSAKSAFYDVIDDLKSRSGFREKFAFEDFSTNPGVWETQKKTLKVQLVTNDLAILQHTELIKVAVYDDSTFINLTELGFYDKEFQLVNHALNDIGVALLLRFQYSSNVYVNGRCGAGQEVGYIALQLDSNLKITGFDRQLIESCNDGIYYEDAVDESGDIINFVVNAADTFDYHVFINKVICKITIQK